MPIEIEFEPNEICVLRIRGPFKTIRICGETKGAGGQNRRRREAARPRYSRELRGL